MLRDPKQPESMVCCGRVMRNWSYYPGLTIVDEKRPHFYCTLCGSHFHKTEWYDKQQWFFYINEMSYEEWQRQEREAQEAADQDRLESLHAHEIINHSDPE